MSEKKPFTGNPFDPSTFIKGGGLWDNKVITVTGFRSALSPMTRKDGSKVLDEKTGQQIIKNVIELTGIADDEETERREQYSTGRLRPTADGEGIVDPVTGAPSAFHENSDAAKFANALVAGGFNPDNIWDKAAQRSKFSGLVGARIRMKAEARLDKDGNVKKNAKGYDVNRFYPVEFLGYKAGGNGHAHTTQQSGSELRDKAVATVTTLLAENGGKLTRADLVRKLSAALAADSDCNKILSLVVREDFHKDAPWTRDGTTLLLA